MLQLLKESVSSKHAERLEQIVIALIAIEIGLSLQQEGIVIFMADLEIFSSRNYYHSC